MLLVVSAGAMALFGWTQFRRKGSRRSSTFFRWKDVAPVSFPRESGLLCDGSAQYKISVVQQIFLAADLFRWPWFLLGYDW
jgi:hypothetical protein